LAALSVGTMIKKITLPEIFPITPLLLKNITRAVHTPSKPSHWWIKIENWTLVRNLAEHLDSHKKKYISFAIFLIFLSQVQTLQKWREETSGEVAPHGSNGKNGQVALIEAGSENTSFPSVLTSVSSVKCSDQGHTQLVNMCAKLQCQVTQLQETLSTVTNYVFQGSVSAGTDRGMYYRTASRIQSWAKISP
jgi:hypothetical protein